MLRQICCLRRYNISRPLTFKRWGTKNPWDYLLNNKRQDLFVLGIPGLTDVLWGRKMFFLTLKQLVPKAIDDLISVLDVYVEIMKAMFPDFEEEGTDFNFDLQDIYKFSINSAHLSKYNQLRSVIDSWIYKYNIGPWNIWIRNEIPLIFYVWLKDPIKLKNKEFQYHGHTIQTKMKEILSNVNSCLNKDTPVADPLKYTLDEFLKRCRQLYNENYRTSQSFGFVNTKKKTEAKKHFEWLICYHVLQMSYEEIADKYLVGDKERTNASRIIQRQIFQLADLIRLDLDKNRIGRPKKMNRFFGGKKKSDILRLGECPFLCS